MSSKRTRHSYRFFHIHIIDFFRSLFIGITAIVILVNIFQGTSQLVSTKQDNSFLNVLSPPPIDSTALLKQCFSPSREPPNQNVVSEKRASVFAPLFSLLSNTIPVLQPLFSEIMALYTLSAEADIPVSLGPAPLPESSHDLLDSTSLLEGALPIRDITIAPQSAQGYVNSGNIYVNNYTSYSINISELLSAPLPFSYNKNDIQVLIIHTHGTESYSRENAQYYTQEDTNRSMDNEENIIRIGEEMAKRLSAAGIGVIHNKTIHDHPSFNGSYSNAEKTIVAELNAHPSIQIVLDIHRDAMITAEGVKYRPVLFHNNTNYAQIMLVMGSDEGGLTHKNWRENLSVALKLQKELNDRIPNLARPLYLKKERFNQHTTPGSLLIEMGASGNYQSDALHSVEPLCDALIALIQSPQK